MDTFAPLFSRIVDSSLWDEADHVVKVFLTMLAKKDADHVVRASAYMIGKWARKTEKEALDALKVLSSPDKNRLEPQVNEGRRIKKVEDGWLVLNGAAYRKMASEVAEKARKAAWARESRAREKEKEVNNRDDLIRIHEKHAKELRMERDEQEPKASEPTGTSCIDG